jgi:G3E family GTPase
VHVCGHFLGWLTPQRVCVAQVEFADVLIINKADLVTPKALRQLELVLEKLNPTARVVTTQFGRIPPATLLDTGLFSAESLTSEEGSLNRQSLGGLPHWVEGVLNGGASSAERGSLEEGGLNRLQDIAAGEGDALGERIEGAEGGSDPVGEGERLAGSPGRESGTGMSQGGTGAARHAHDCDDECGHSHDHAHAHGHDDADAHAHDVDHVHGHERADEDVKYGIGSFVYRADR